MRRASDKPTGKSFKSMTAASFNPLPPSDAVRKQRKNLEDLSSLVPSQLKKYHPCVNLKFNSLAIFQSLKLHILMESILPNSLKLNFTKKIHWVVMFSAHFERYL